VFYLSKEGMGIGKHTHTHTFTDSQVLEKKNKKFTLNLSDVENVALCGTAHHNAELYT
jgi:hypothetical protein